jgi:hypothetical protein
MQLKKIRCERYRLNLGDFYLTEFIQYSYSRIENFLFIPHQNKAKNCVLSLTLSMF